MLTKSAYHFDLPQALIAQTPLAERSASRLLCLDRGTGAYQDRRFRELPELLDPRDIVIFNDTRVIPARLYGHKASGGRVEILIERLLDDQNAWAHLKASKTPRPGTHILLDAAHRAEVVIRDKDLFQLAFTGPLALPQLLQRLGHVPLPPYIQRPDRAEDRERYQTIFARRDGAIAAPTAGLHFDAPTMERLRARGIATAQVTLHVGSGTFQPVRVEDLSAHRMHQEWYEVSAETVAAIDRARQRGGRVVAIGTTVVRALEAASRDGTLRAGSGETDLFITPGYTFRSIDAMLTNFHLPESTLLMLVCAFAGYEPVMRAYRHAVAERYRFFSYGDAMFLAHGLTAQR